MQEVVHILVTVERDLVTVEKDLVMVVVVVMGKEGEDPRDLTIASHLMFNNIYFFLVC